MKGNCEKMFVVFWRRVPAKQLWRERGRIVECHNKP
jgi:hypothetical protein